MLIALNTWKSLCKTTTYIFYRGEKKSSKVKPYEKMNHQDENHKTQ